MTIERFILSLSSELAPCGFFFRFLTEKLLFLLMISAESAADHRAQEGGRQCDPAAALAGRSLLCVGV